MVWHGMVAALLDSVKHQHRGYSEQSENRQRIHASPAWRDGLLSDYRRLDHPSARRYGSPNKALSDGFVFRHQTLRSAFEAIL
jgi:hypothetical protein